MISIGCDLAYTKHGVIVLDDDHVEYFTVLQTKSPDDEDDWIHAVASFLTRLAIHYQPVVINVEGLSFNGRGSSALQQAGLHYVVRNYFYEQGFRFNVVPPKTLKKIATGNGNASKDLMFDHVPENVQKMFLAEGYKKSTGLFDLVDAYHLAQLNETWS